MTYSIYGLRLKDDPEVRYVGITSHSPTRRMVGHRGDSTSPAQRWLLDNRGKTEAFTIAKSDSHETAKAIERVVIAFCLRLNHRLLNCDHVPAHLRALDAA